MATCVLLGAGVLLRVTLAPPATYTPDEQVYATFAAGFLEGGYSRYPEVVRNYLSDPSLAEIPSPIRAGYYLLLSAAMGMSGERTITAVAGVSLLASVLLLALATWTAWRLLPPVAAAFATLFLLASPLDLAIARRGWQDGVFALAAFAAFAAVAAHAARPRGVTRLAFFMAAFAALLIKETGVVVLGLGGALLAGLEWRDRGGRAALAVAAGVAAVLATAAAVLAALCGGASTFAELLRVTASGREASEYALRYQTGSPLYYATGLALLQPLPWAAGTLTAIAALLHPTARRWLLATPGTARAHDAGADRAITVLAALHLAFLLVAALASIKNLRFLAPLFPTTALFAGAAVRALVASAMTRMPGAPARVTAGVVTAGLLALAALDWWRFDDLFVRRGIPDLATPWFTGAP